MGSGSATFWVYTEDSGDHAVGVLRSLLLRLCRRLEPGVQTQKLDIRAPKGDERRAWWALGFKNPRHPQRRLLVRALATALARGDALVLHHDGDVPWPGESPHREHVDHLLAEVDRLLSGAPGEAADPGGRVLLRVVPHYSIESWLYLNHAAAERIVAEGRRKPEVLAWLNEKRAAGGGYDQVAKPKDGCPLGAGHNHELSERWDAARAAAASPSWAKLEQVASGHAELRRRLRATYGG